MFKGTRGILRLYRLIVSQVLEGTCRLQVIPILERVSWLRERDDHLEGVSSQIHMGERHLLGPTDRCHGLRRPDRRFRGMMILGNMRHPWRIHVFQQVMLL
jgi:hypothetical protein